MESINIEKNNNRSTHSPLLDTAADSSTRPHIRLLEVHARESPDQPLHVPIHRTSVEDAPAYQAIYYTWGVENDQECIYIEHAHSSLCNASEGELPAHDGYMMVRKDCADVLRQFEHFKFSRYYWIDAICINRTDVQ